MADTENDDNISPQAWRIISRFGTPARLSRILCQIADIAGDERIARNKSSICRWTYARRRRGTGGIIPGHMQRHINQAARLDGIILTPEDWIP